MKKPQAEAWEKIRAQVYEAIREALITLRGNRMRSGLVILGVMIGVASLMGMVAILSGLEKFIATSITGGETPFIILAKTDFLSGESGRKEWEKRKNFTTDDALAIETINHVRGVLVFYGRGVVVKYKERKAQAIQLIGTNQPFLQVNNITIAEGRYFSPFEQEHRRNLVVLGDKSAHSLFPYEDPVGKHIRIEGKEYEVLGVFDKRKTIFGGLADNFIAIPYTSFERDFLWWREPPQIRVIVEGKPFLDQAKEDIRALLRMRRKVPIGQPDDFAVVTADAVIEFTKSITDKIVLALVVLSSIALMVGGIGVMVIMLVSVTERTPEIGVRKAIGATRGQITWQFLIEAATLSGIGGVLGILAGIAGALFFSKLLGFPFVLPIGWVFVAVMMSAGVGLFFGIFPARKAAKLHPIEALRHE